VVDDDPDVREVIALLLEDEGYEVASCGDGSRAWELMRADPPPQLVILDLMLPRMDGWELRARQRADSMLARIPVIAISADSSPKASAISADAFLHKPVRASDLLNTVDRVLIGRGIWTPGEELENVYRLAAAGRADRQHRARAAQPARLPGHQRPAGRRGHAPAAGPPDHHQAQHQRPGGAPGLQRDRAADGRACRHGARRPASAATGSTTSSRPWARWPAPTPSGARRWRWCRWWTPPSGWSAVSCAGAPAWCATIGTRPR
jgi:CheY-like chemotaxis protein